VNGAEWTVTTPGAGDEPEDDEPDQEWPCPVDGDPCVVVERFALPLVRLLAEQQPGGDPGALFRRTVGRVCRELPCDRCQVAEGQVLELPRLGRNERRALLAAPPPDAEAQIIAPAGPGRAADEANRRALRTLERAGLLALGWDRGRFRKRTARRTWLGQAVVERLRTVLESGRRIRWADHRGALIAEYCLPTDGLLRVFLGRVQESLEGWVELAQCEARLAERFSRGHAGAKSSAEVAALELVLRAAGGGGDQRAADSPARAHFPGGPRETASGNPKP
jgi:hypothetical protein